MKLLFTSAVMALVVASTSTYADVWQERDALSHIISELNALERLAAHAAEKSDKDSRIQFDYDALRADLEVIRLGLNDYLSKPLDPTVSFTDITADYESTAAPRSRKGKDSLAGAN